MSNEIIVSNNLPTNEYDVDATLKRIEVLKKFVQKNLKEGIDNDYAVVPGTNKKSLLKPGAQKIRLLFGLGIKTSLSNRTFDIATNYYIVTYKSQVIHLASGNVIAECEGTASSLEKKYRMRKIWKSLPGGGREQVEEETPIGDLMNTLDKMAQKRSNVGATIEAIGGSDFFTQDLDDEIEQEQANLRPNTDQVKRNANQDGEVVIPNCPTETCENHGKPLNISKFINKQTNAYDYYCPKCKVKKAAV